MKRSMPLLLTLAILHGIGLLWPTSPARSDPSAETTKRTPCVVPVHDDQTTFSIPTTGPSDRSLLVVSALGRTARDYPVTLNVRSTSTADQPTPLVFPPPRPLPRLAAADLPSDSHPQASFPIDPPTNRAFDLLVRDGDPASPDNYIRVQSTLRSVGRHTQVYVDTRDLPSHPAGVVENLIQTFDDVIHPISTDRWGPSFDVDGDGRLTVLLTSWLAHLGGGALAVQGCVRPADFDPRISAPFSNRCDMIYLDAGLLPGPHLQTILAHEYGHVLMMSRKTLPALSPNGFALEEEAWLDEAIAHRVEDDLGFSQSNLAHRIAAYRADPASYSLIVPDYHRANLFRSHGHRGAAYLFLSECCQAGDGLTLLRLMSSRSVGVANLEQSTGVPFATLFQSWSIAPFLDDRTPSSRLPRFQSVDPGTPPLTQRLASTATTYYVVDGSSTGAIQVHLEAPPDAQLQVSWIPLPTDRPRVDLSIHPLPSTSGRYRFRVGIRNRDEWPVALTQLSWIAPQLATAADLPRGAWSGSHLQSILGNLHLGPHGQLESVPIELDLSASPLVPLVFELQGLDARNRPVAAWHQTTPAASALAVAD